MTLRSLSRAGTLAVAAILSACSSMTEVGIVAQPKISTIFINGEKQGSGKRLYVFDFDKHPRAVLQATAYGYRPHKEIWTAETLEKHLSQFGKLEITLEQER